MNKFDLSHLQFKLFSALYKVKSLKLAAAEVNISVQAAGRELQKLRLFFNDLLFERSGNYMIPTAKASELQPRVEDLLRSYETVVFSSVFNPSDLDRRIHIAAVDNACVHILEEVFPRILKAAPGVQLWISNIDQNTFPALKNGELDLALFPRVPLPPDFHSLNVVTSGYCYVTRKGHPLEAVYRQKGTLTKRDVNKYPSIVANAQPDTRLEPNGPAKGAFNPSDPKSVKMIVPYFLAAPYFLLESDYTLVAPVVTMRKVLDPSRFCIFPMQDDAPKLTSRLVWHERVHRDPANQWIRSLFASIEFDT